MIPLKKQITALRILINTVERGQKFKPSEVNYYKEQWEAAYETMMWLEKNDEAIKRALGHEKSKESGNGI